MHHDHFFHGQTYMYRIVCFFSVSSVVKGVIHPPHPTSIQLLHFSGNAMIALVNCDSRKDRYNVEVHNLCLGGQVEVQM